MTFPDFKDSLILINPPADIPKNLLALWYDGVGDWNKAHTIVQETSDEMGDRIHAYLHRKEGDHANAAYWYRRTGRAIATTSLEVEWASLANGILTNSNSSH